MCECVCVCVSVCECVCVCGCGCVKAYSNAFAGDAIRFKIQHFQTCIDLQNLRQLLKNGHKNSIHKTRYTASITHVVTHYVRHIKDLIQCNYGTT